MKVLLTLYGDETAFVNATPEFIAREMADWQAFDEAAGLLSRDVEWRLQRSARRGAGGSSIPRPPRAGCVIKSPAAAPTLALAVLGTALQRGPS
jgi:hypothetical protein